MLIQINITIPPSGSAGPFDLYSDADGYVDNGTSFYNDTGTITKYTP